MKLSAFAVVHERGDVSAVLDDPLVHSYSGKQLILTYVSRQALMDHFRIPGDSGITLAQWNSGGRPKSRRVLAHHRGEVRAR